MSRFITGIHHVSMKCCDEAEYQKTIEFYQKVLGLTLVRTWGSGADAGAMLDSGAGLIEIFANGDKRLEQGAIRHFAFAVKDVDAVAKAVCEAGYEVFVKPKEIVIKSEPEYPARIAFCIGPVGEHIEFFQEKGDEA